MSEFIKLTCALSGGPAYVCRDEIRSVAWAKEDDHVFTEVGLRYLGAAGCHVVQETPEEIMALLEETPAPCLPQPPPSCPDVRFAAGQFLWAMMCVKNRFNVRRPGWADGRVLNTGNFHHAASMDEGDIFADDWKLSHAHLLSSERQPRTAEVLQERGENQ